MVDRRLVAPIRLPTVVDARGRRVDPIALKRRPERQRVQVIAALTVFRGRSVKEQIEGIR